MKALLDHLLQSHISIGRVAHILVANTLHVLQDGSIVFKAHPPEFSGKYTDAIVGAQVGGHSAQKSSDLNKLNAATATYIGFHRTGGVANNDGRPLPRLDVGYRKFEGLSQGFL